jgi:O-antigen ligase
MESAPKKTATTKTSKSGKQETARVELSDRQASLWLIWGGSLVTLFFWTTLNDPFNAPKSWVLGVAGFWLLGWVLFQVKAQIKDRTMLWTTILAGAYLLAFFMAWLFTDNKYIGMFGDYQRRTGFLSYFCLITFLVAAAYLFRLKRILALELAGLIVGFITGIYGFLQHFNHDFVKWNNPYNSVLSTLGNPDFAAAAIAIFLVLSFGVAVQVAQPQWLRALAALNVILLLTVIVFSQVRQGLLAGAIGIAVIVIVWIWQRNMIAAWVLTALSVLGGLAGVAGMLNIGPLTKYFYKISVTYRGDYWRAGWRMFINHPFFGVGLDRYGAYFRQYRDNTQSVRRGPNLISNAAHNVPVQLASTGGIFVLLTFLALTIFIAWRGIVALRKNRGTEQMVVAIIFGAWVTYEAQSLISIDNLAIAIWGYILGGAVIGLSVVDGGIKKVARESILQPVVSSALALVMMVVGILFFEAESNMHMLGGIQAPKSQTDIATYEQYALKPLGYLFKEPSFEVTIAGDFAQAGNLATSISQLQAVIKNDSHSYAAQDLLSRIYEYQKNFAAATPIRQAMVKEDPFNPPLAKQLATDLAAK